MDIKLYNSLTNKIEPLNPLHEGEVSMYVCGPTVYSYVHIGNMRPVVVFDTLRRFLSYVGYKVTYVSNYTDVDDKIINEAQRVGKNEREITNFYIEAFEKDLNNIHAKKPNITPRVTEYMPKIIEFIDKLVESGAAYVVDGDVYFRVEKVKDYGCLSNTKIDDLLVGARIEENSKKESPLDFTLWKQTDVGVAWESPWSKGRPGWHTECVVMINSLFENGHIDIHGGGFDLKFPHHENEIAQSVALNNHKIANVWMHNGFININNEKMSKSLGNVVTAKDALARYGGNTVRLLLLSTHYRAPVNFAEEMLNSNEKELNKISTAMKQLAVALQKEGIDIDSGKATEMEGFLSALANDVNTSNAISELFGVLKKINTSLRCKILNYTVLQGLFFTLRDMLDILGIEITFPRLTVGDKALLKQYDDAKTNKDFVKSDEIRQQLIARGIM